MDSSERLFSRRSFLTTGIAAPALAAGTQAPGGRPAVFDVNYRKLLAGADLLLMPSLYEPCGLTQMRAQRYGVIPIVRAVGGLQDSVQEGVTGFLFGDYTPAALEEVVERVLQRYADRDGWGVLVRQAMASRFGWDQSTVQYSALYRRALTTHAHA